MGTWTRSRCEGRILVEESLARFRSLGGRIASRLVHRAAISGDILATLKQSGRRSSDRSHDGPGNLEPGNRGEFVDVIGRRQTRARRSHRRTQRALRQTAVFDVVKRSFRGTEPRRLSYRCAVALGEFGKCLTCVVCICEVPRNVSITGFGNDRRPLGRTGSWGRSICRAPLVCYPQSVQHGPLGGLADAL